MGFLATLLANLRQGPATEPFPFGPAATPPHFRGRVTIDPAACTGCRLCEYVCPGGAIHIAETARGLDLTVWHNSCVFCGLCARYCLSRAIRQTADWHLAHSQAEKYALVDRVHVAKPACIACGKPFQAASEAVMGLAFKGRTGEIERMRRLCPDCRRIASVSGGRHVPSQA